MGITTNVQSVVTSSEKFQDWFIDSTGKQGEESPAASPTQKPKDKGQTLTFENVRIDFPLSPYPAQVQMMRKIIHTLNTSENALLESPTGSGKSLALLCAALAWRENEEKVVSEKFLQEQRKALEEKDIENKDSVVLLDTQPPVLNQVLALDQASAKSEAEVLNQLSVVSQATLSDQSITLDQSSHSNLAISLTQPSISIDPSQTQHSVQSESMTQSLSEDSNFQDYIPSKRQAEYDNHPKNWKKKFKCIDDKVITVEDDSFEDFQKGPVNDENKPPPGLVLKVDPDEINSMKYQTYKKVPRIFVGSRTHKQITQLVKELKSKTRYKPRTTILGSREHLCIHPKVSKAHNKTEACVDLLDKGGCSYSHKTRKILNHASLKSENRIWDIEDMVKLGKRVRGCPYYASRKLYEGAEVIFCPYNYIIDPIIRKILDINLKDGIVILDEAHNIEDSSRSAGSFEVDDQVLSIIRKELEYIIRNGVEVEAHHTLALIIENLHTWITSEDINYSIKEYESHYSHWTGSKLLDKLNSENITANTYEISLLPAYKTAASYAEQVRKETEARGTGETEEEEEGSSQVKIHYRKCLSNNSLTVIQGIFMVFGLLFEENENYADDYQMVLSRNVERSSEKGRRKRRNNDEDNGPQWLYKIGFKCLNPGVIFKKMTEETRSVILTSGTLSPLNTFASELETKFEGRLEANHVIHKSQVWVGAIPRGPNRYPLKGVFSNMESFQYQDDIGESLCQIVEAVPFGVLCFMPSYNALDKFIKRWKTTDMYDRLLARKMIISEPRGSDKREFENAIGRFYKQVDDVEIDVDEEDRDGALFFAVFRGKVSEGIDFTDNYCRAVVTIGIPYPGVKEMEVKFKKDYNDRKRVQQRNFDILSSNEWYSAQAFRAINQALGRCIRHKNDWGAIIMLEERFENDKIVQGLSKWVRNQFKIYPQFSFALSNLQEFVKAQIDRTSMAPPEIKIQVNSEASCPAGLDASSITTTIKSEAILLESSTSTEMKIEQHPLSAVESLSTPTISGNNNLQTNSSNYSVDFKPSILNQSLHLNEPVYNNSPTETKSSAHIPASTVKSPFFPETSSVDESRPSTKLDVNSTKSEALESKEVIYKFDSQLKKVKEEEEPWEKMNTTSDNEELVAKVEHSDDFQIPASVRKNLISRDDLENVNPYDTTQVRIACSSCKESLLTGSIGNLKSITITDLALISKNNHFKNKALIEVCKPELWKTTDSLFGGPIDVNRLPNEASVILNRSDETCYRTIGCSCSSAISQGIVICQAFNVNRTQYTGRVFIWLNQLTIEKEEIVQQVTEHMETFSSQIPTINDLFYSLQ